MATVGRNPVGGSVDGSKAGGAGGREIQQREREHQPHEREQVVGEERVPGGVPCGRAPGEECGESPRAEPEQSEVDGVVGHARGFRRLVLLRGDDPRGREVRDGVRGEERAVDSEQRRPAPEAQELEDEQHDGARRLDHGGR